MVRLRRLLPAILLAAAVPAASPASGWAEMTSEDRTAFGAEVRSFLLENPDILTEMVALLDVRDRATAAAQDRDRIAEQSDALFADGFSFAGGDPDADVTVVAFLDYQCGYCRRAHPEFMDMVEADGGIRWIVKELPILGPASEQAARAAVATLIAEGPAAYARFSDRMLRLDGPVSEASIAAALDAAEVDAGAVRAGMDHPEVTRRIDATRALAQALGIQGTPSFVFGDRMLRGYAPLDAMQALVDELRAAAD